MTRLLSVTITIFIMTLSQFSFAGNGVERGYVVDDGIQLPPEVTELLKSKLSFCRSSQKSADVFSITSIDVKKDFVDQGIVDRYYTFLIEQSTNEGHKVNTLKVEVLDSDYQNWSNYSEKLSASLLYDQHNFCK